MDEGELGLGSGEGELTDLGFGQPRGGVDAQLVNGDGDVIIAEPLDLARLETVEALGADELHPAGTVLADVGEEIEGLVRTLELTRPTGAHLLVVRKQPVEVRGDPTARVLLVEQRHADRERRGSRACAVGAVVTESDALAASV